MWWQKVASTSGGAANAAATRFMDDAMLLHNGVWGLVRSMTGQKASQAVVIDKVRSTTVMPPHVFCKISTERL